MIKIRKSTFETNSSSTHSLVIGMAEEMDAWMEGKTLYCMYHYSKSPFEEGKFYDKEFVDNYIRENNPGYEPEEMYGDYELYKFHGNHFYLNENTEKVISIIKQKMCQ